MTEKKKTTSPTETETKLQRDIQRARAAAKLRKEAPQIQGNAPYTCPRAKLVARLRQCGAIRSGMSPFFGEAAKYDEYVGDGYEPVVFEGMAQGHGGDPLFQIDAEIPIAAEGEAVSESHSRLVDPTPEAKDNPHVEEEMIVEKGQSGPGG